MSKDSDPTRRGAGPPPSAPHDPERATSSQEQDRISLFLKELARSPDGDPRDAFAGFRVGERVGKFELLREMGRGGFGVVYEALDHELGRKVAFKAVRPGRPGAGQRGELWLQSEAKAAARLSHPNIVTLYDFGTCPAGAYLVMELLQGDTLEKRLDHGPLSPKEAVRIGVEVARALCHAHAAGVLHRDVKPSNVFLTEDGAVKVLDLGLARVLGTAGPGGGGTPAFMAPEQWLGAEEDVRTDLFSASAVLFQSLTGEIPFAVTRERSAVLDPGPPPEPKRPGVPRQLAALVRSALSREPADRPRNAQVWLEGLLAAERAMARREERRRNRRAWVGAGLVALVAASVVTAVTLLSPAGPTERITVIVPDVENHTQQVELGTISEMYVTALIQSRHVNFMTRWQTLDVLAKLGHERVDRIDEALARKAAAAVGARAILVGSVRQFGDTFALELAAVDLEKERYLFKVQAKGTGSASIPDSVDRIASAARTGFKEGEEQLRASSVKVQAVLTENLEAYQHYYRGVECSNRFGLPQKTRTCADEYRRAIALDPGFTMAHYRLALATQYRTDMAAERAAAIEAAVRGSPKLPPKERALIEALAALEAKRTEVALGLYRKLIDEHPLDKQILYLAGDVLHHRGELGPAADYFERALDLDPGLALDQSLEWPLAHLADDLGRLGRVDRLTRLHDKWSAAPPSPATLRAAAESALWLGRPQDAVRAASRAVALEGDALTRRELARARFFTGDLRGAEAALRIKGSETGPWLAWLAAAQGRGRDALESLSPADPAYSFYRAALLLPHDRARGVEAAREYRKAAPAAAASLSVALAHLGDAATAADFARGLDRNSAAGALYAALVAWKSGEGARAKASLQELERKDLVPQLTPPPSFLLGEVCFDTGDDTCAVEALDRYRTLPYFGIWQGWAWPRALVLLARSHERLGNTAAARKLVEELTALLKAADPDYPPLAEARALRSRIGPR